MFSLKFIYIKFYLLYHILDIFQILCT